MTSISPSLTAVPPKYLPLVMKWDEVCLPLGLRFDYDLSEKDLSTKDGMCAFVKHLLAAAQDPASVGGSCSPGFRRQAQCAAMSEVIMWFLIVYGREFLCTQQKFFKVVLLKLVELREEVKTMNGLEKTLVLTLTEFLLFYKRVGSSVFKPKLYVSILSLFRGAFSDAPTPCFTERFGRIRTMQLDGTVHHFYEPVEVGTVEIQDEKEEIVEVDSRGPVEVVEERQDEKEEIVEKLPSRSSWFSFPWFW